MKQKLLLILVAGALLSACSTSQTQTEQKAEAASVNSAAISSENPLGHTAAEWKEIKDNK